MFYVYIISNWNNKVYYTGFTDDLEKRVYEHKHKLLDGFTAKYNCNKLLYYEESPVAEDALHREQQIKRYTKSLEGKSNYKS